MNMMRRMLVLFIVVMLFVACSTGMAQETPGDFPERGLTLNLTQQDLDDGLNVYSIMDGWEEVFFVPALYFVYTTPTGMDASKQVDELAEILTEDNMEEYMPQIEDLFETEFANQHDALILYMVASEHYTEGCVENAVLIGESNGYVYLSVSNPNGVTLEDPEEQKLFEQAIERCETLVNTMTFQPVVFDEDDFLVFLPEEMPAFTAEDLAGNTVTEEILSGKDLTAVIIWLPNGMASAEEMHEFALWDKELPENVQTIGIVMDFGYEINEETVLKARSICEEAGVEFTNLVLNDDLYDFVSAARYAPTFLFAKADGTIVGSSVPDSGAVGYSEFVETYFKDKN